MQYIPSNRVASASSRPQSVQIPADFWATCSRNLYCANGESSSMCNGLSSGLVVCAPGCASLSEYLCCNLAFAIWRIANQCLAQSARYFRAAICFDAVSDLNHCWYVRGHCIDLRFPGFVSLLACNGSACKQSAYMLARCGASGSSSLHLSIYRGDSREWRTRSR